MQYMFLSCKNRLLNGATWEETCLCPQGVMCGVSLTYMQSKRLVVVSWGQTSKCRCVPRGDKLWCLSLSRNGQIQKVTAENRSQGSRVWKTQIPQRHGEANRWRKRRQKRRPEEKEGVTGRSDCVFVQRGEREARGWKIGQSNAHTQTEQRQFQRVVQTSNRCHFPRSQLR